MGMFDAENKVIDRLLGIRHYPFGESNPWNCKDPIKNPLEYKMSDQFKFDELGKGGFLFKKTQRHDELYNDDQMKYAVPASYESPNGFFFDGMDCYATPSRMLALMYYREYDSAKPSVRREFDPIVKAQDELFKLSSATDCDIELPKLKSSFTPRPHQKVGIDYLSRINSNLLIADGMRSGKTGTSILITASREFDKCLIVCPAIVQTVWRSSIESILDNPKIKILESGDELESGYNIISYDKVHTIDAKVDICIADEIHFIIQPDARRSIGMSKIQADLKIGLSGTPILNDTDEILGVLDWLDKDIHAKIKHFLQWYEGDPYTVSNQLATELRKRCMILRTTESLTPESAVFTNTIEIDCTLPESATLQEVGRYKIPYAVEYINAYADEKIIVAVQYLKTARQLAMSLGSQAVVITGETPEAIRAATQKAFSDGARILIGSSAISEGLDFSFSNRILLVESGYSFRTEQLRARCDKVGKQEPVSVDILVCNHPKDKRVMEVLDEKYDVSFGFKD